MFGTHSPSPKLGTQSPPPLPLDGPPALLESNPPLNIHRTPPPIPLKPPGISSRKTSPAKSVHDSNEDFSKIRTDFENLEVNSSKLKMSVVQDARQIIGSNRITSTTNGHSNGHSNGHKMDRATLISGGVKEMTGYVGFANIPNQLFRKAIKQGFDFTLMVVGQSGLGKSTFINSLFLAEIYDIEMKVPPAKKTTKIEERTVTLTEAGVTLNLNLIDTPGFGDAIDNNKCWEPIVQVVDKRCSEFLSSETKVNRKEKIADNRVHCCLYFISPNGHGLRELDIELMRQLQDRVNIIPVIAKADTMTKDEVAAFKTTIMSEIKQNKIKIYEFPDPEDEDERKDLQALKDRVPFAVVGSNVIIDTNGKKSRCREYSWGRVEVENVNHSDFAALRNMLIRTHLMDLMDVTKAIHYENFRVRQLANFPNTDKDPFSQMEDDQKSHTVKLQKKKEDMDKVLEQKVQEKLKKHTLMEDDYKRRMKDLEDRLKMKRQEHLNKQTGLDEYKRTNPGLATYESKTSLGSTGSDSKKKKNLFGI